ncbi:MULTISPECIES: LacI family DNA-binding transcriptional regulator [unclassified Novosphingobium]|uniref:LacI family DNA-binding transcriptional regulator n=1 Tax=unclassified Novosphingobium TaxID=2644732 RepID=UPI00146E2363|nr:MULTISPECIES: LacI family DNA-binding transcriptional regulator [unclassified Novosphingobium]NMN05046.1 LacI family transcriptional regulator [Novosphingobium sp. SG919]NMN87340.1 LacI family transcriptional regulator [Novosphingobium sp. SG916]
MQTIKDVAALAGVSDRTVSRVVNGEPNISSKTRARVEEAIARLNYIPNLAARMVRTNRSGVIGLITDVVSTTPNSVEIIRGVQERVSQANQSLLIANTSGTAEGEKRVWRTFQEHRIDGVLFATMYHHEIDFDPNMHNIPAVLVNCFAARANVPAVVPDDRDGGYAAARHALDKGHTSIAFVTLNPLILASSLRREGFARAMAEAGVPIREEWIVPGISGAIGSETMQAYAAARQLLDAPAASRPTIILAGNDEIAMQCMFAAASLGLGIPNDIAIVGFDDFRMISEQVVPPLTTVALPYYQIGVRAADRLFALLAGADEQPTVERLPCPLVQRAST